MWGGWFSHRTLTLLVKHALRRAARARTPWATVPGHAATFVQTVKRRRWDLHDAVRVTLDDGTRFNFAMDSPAHVKFQAHQSACRWRWRAGA